MSPDKSSYEVVDVNEAYTQEKSKKATKVSNEAVVVIREFLSLNDNLTLRQSLKDRKKFSGHWWLKVLHITTLACYKSITNTTYDDVLSLPYRPLVDPMSRTVYSVMRQFLLHPVIIRSSSRLLDPMVTLWAREENASLSWISLHVNLPVTQFF